EGVNGRASLKLLVERIGILEPGTRKSRVELDGVLIGQLEIKAIEGVLLVALVVHYLEFGRVEKPAGVQSAQGNVVAPFRASVGKVHIAGRRAERAVRS